MAKENNNQLRPVAHSTEAEAALVGSMIIEPSIIAHVLESVMAEDFFDHDIQVWFMVIERVFRKCSAVDIPKLDAITFRTEYKESGFSLDGTEHGIDETESLIRLANAVPSAANYERYIDIVKAKKAERDLALELEKVTNIVYESGLNVEQKQAAFEQAALQLKLTSTQTEPIQKVLTDAYNKWEKGIDFGLPTGFKDLDLMIGGLQAGEMVVVAGRPSMGKSSFALDCIIHQFETKERTAHRVALFSMEMNKYQLTERFLCSMAEIDIYTLKKQYEIGMISKDLHDAQEFLYKQPLWVDETASMTVAQLAAKVMRVKAQYDVELVIIDYLQLLTVGKRVESRQQEVTEISRELKALAKRVQIPIVIVAQLNRAAEMRLDHEPRMSDLRESGSIENDADIILFLHRPPYYAIKEGRMTEDSGEAYVIVSKNRQGRTGKIPLAWCARNYSFKNADDAEEPKETDIFK